ncbi:hypothetical protein [Nocardioides pocheonensis]|uniref:Uncharacterized protein n=1 Tax=Nocardioides pocheonensis TaxID=661485 RepID=A0A3N0GLZ8_9ACTN|nr:hypothetical protein [Nocardioides pocheonensis]RNM13090.1 hypothetical protein EFL26_16835 [Nocardioides pocheonensis]
MTRPASVHLRRTERHVAAIDALVDRHGEPVGVAGVLDHLNRSAERTPVPGLAVEWGFRWDDEDAASERWWPQGITNSAHVPGIEQRLLVISWYAKDGRGSRITVVDLETLRYRHVLLVVPEIESGAARLRPLAVHAGGLVWAGPYLYVAGTRRGLFTCRMEEILEVEPGRETSGHRFVLPVRFGYDASGDGEPMRYSFLSLDRSTEVPHLVAGEYARGDMTRRIVRYPLDPGTFHLAAEEDGLSRPVLLDDRGLGHMQGAAIVRGTYYVTTSRGRWKLGALQVGHPGAFHAHRQALPAGPEDLCYREDDDLLWSLTEYPGRRFVFSVRRGDLRP